MIDTEHLLAGGLLAPAAAWRWAGLAACALRCRPAAGCKLALAFSPSASLSRTRLVSRQLARSFKSCFSSLSSASQRGHEQVGVGADAHQRMIPGVAR